MDTSKFENRLKFHHEGVLRYKIFYKSQVVEQGRFVLTEIEIFEKIFINKKVMS